MGSKHNAGTHSPTDVANAQLANSISHNKNYVKNNPLAIIQPIVRERDHNNRNQVECEDDEDKLMDCKLELVGLDAVIIFFQLLHRLSYFVYSYNCYHRAYNVKCCPNSLTPLVDWVFCIDTPFLQLR